MRLRLLLTCLLLMAAAPAGSAAPKQPRYLVVGSFGSNVVTVFDADSLRKVASIPTEVKGTCCVYATPDGRTVMAVAGLSAYVTTLDMHTMTVVRNTPVMSRMFTESGSEVQRDGRTFWVTTNDTSPNIAGIDIATGRVRKTLVGVESRDFQVSRDGKAIYLATGTSLIIRSTETGKVLGTTPMKGQRLYVSHDDRTLYAQTGELSSGTPEQVEVVDVTRRGTPRRVASMPLPGAGWYGAFTPDGKQLWVAGADNGLLTVFDLVRRRVARTIDLGNAYGVGVAISRNGRAFVSVTSTPIRPVTGASTALHIAGVVPGAALPVATTRAGFPPGEMWVYDTTTHRKLPVPPMRLPSAAFGPTVIDNAPVPTRSAQACSKDFVLWLRPTGCVG